MFFCDARGRKITCVNYWVVFIVSPCVILLCVTLLWVGTSHFCESVCHTELCCTNLLMTHLHMFDYLASSDLPYLTNLTEQNMSQHTQCSQVSKLKQNNHTNMTILRNVRIFDGGNVRMWECENVKLWKCENVIM